jgi:DNA-binding XRE family transcriptional regulator
MTSRTESPEVLRKEIGAVLDKVTNRGSLLFFQWLLTNISKDEKLPAPDELKKLHGAFVRVIEAFQTGKKVSVPDWEVMFKYVGGIGKIEIARSIAGAVKFYRSRAGLTRLQLANRCRLRITTINALERGQIKDMTLPWVYQLADGLGVDAGEFTDKIMELEKAVPARHEG